MKYFTLNPAFLALLVSLALSAANAGPIPATSELSQREPFESRNFDGSMEVEIRGLGLSKLGKSKDPERKAKYPTGNPKPETPVGEFRQHTAGKHDDYFG